MLIGPFKTAEPFSPFGDVPPLLGCGLGGSGVQGGEGQDPVSTRQPPHAYRLVCVAVHKDEGRGIGLTFPPAGAANMATRSCIQSESEEVSVPFLHCVVAYRCCVEFVWETSIRAYTGRR